MYGLAQAICRWDRALVTDELSGLARRRRSAFRSAAVALAVIAVTPMVLLIHASGHNAAAAAAARTSSATSSCIQTRRSGSGPLAQQTAMPPDRRLVGLLEVFRRAPSAVDKSAAACIAASESGVQPRYVR
jgi:hypothetical protein